MVTMVSRFVVAAAAAAVIGALPAPPLADAPASHAMGQWTPRAPYDTCSAAYHDSFSVVAADGKRYPTWHPPVGTENGRECTFGHEHGRDPKGSAVLADVEAQYGGVPFGFANEQLDVYNADTRAADRMRHEDHVGHKIEWENDVRVFESISPDGADMRALQVTCDFFMKIHQGTHSPDAFANNLHELLYAAQCRDRPDGRIGTKLVAFTMVQFGDPGGFSEGSPAGGFEFVAVRPPSPLKSPAGHGRRSIPTLGRIRFAALVAEGQPSDYSRALYEDWISSNYLQESPDRPALAYFDPHFAVFLPSRFHWPPQTAQMAGVTRTADDVAAQIGRSVDLCDMDDGGRQARGGECARVRELGDHLAYDDPRSPFNGVRREFYFNQTTLANAGGPTTWYTDPFGGHARRGAFPGAIKQFIASIDNRKRDERGFVHAGGRTFPFESRALGKDRWYGGPGVHAPN